MGIQTHPKTQYTNTKMSSPLSSDIPKPFGSTEKLTRDVNRAFALPVPAFGDLSKAANDLINKDFYHTAQATLDVKLKAPNGTNVTVKGKQSFDGVTTGSVEGKHTLKPQNVTVTQAWTTASLLDTKVELANVASTGVKVDLQNLWNPSKPNSAAQKLNLAFKNYGLANGNLDAVLDVTAGHEGFLVGGEAAYDVQKGKPSGLEVASKYKLDPLTFAKVKINDRGIAALAYSTKLNAGTTLGLGLSLDTAKLNEAGHKIGTSLTFEG